MSCLTVSNHQPQFVARVAGQVVALILAMALVVGLSPSAQAQDPARTFMQAAANALISAQRQGTQEAFSRVVSKYGHVPAIGMDALGEFRPELTQSSRQSYYSGLVKYIGRYAASEGRKYPVARVAFPAPAVRDGRHVMVDSEVYLADGTQYNVRWMLVPRGSSFRVRDAQVLGFWVSPFLKDLFSRYIRENGGRVDALVIALNR